MLETDAFISQNKREKASFKRKGKETRSCYITLKTEFAVSEIGQNIETVTWLRIGLGNLNSTLHTIGGYVQLNF